MCYVHGHYISERMYLKECETTYFHLFFHAEGRNLNSYELWLTHKALAFARSYMKHYINQGLNISARLRSGSLKWDAKKDFVAHTLPLWEVCASVMFTR